MVNDVMVNEDAVPLKDFCALDEMNAFWLQMVMDDLSVFDELV